MENKIVEDLEELKTLEEEDIPEEEQIQAPVKVKKPRSPAQIEAFAKVIAKREENRLLRKASKEIQEVEDKKLLDAKLIKKAIAVKKRQIKQQKILELDEPDDEKIELKKVVTNKIVVAPPEKPKLVINFI